MNYLEFFSMEDLSLVVESLSHVRVFATSWTAARQASLSFTVAWSLLRFMSLISRLSSHLIISV